MDLVVPRRIHQIWIQGAASVPPKYHRARSSWPRLNPDWSITVWDNTSIEALIREEFGEAALEQYRNIPRVIIQADVARCYILAVHGGVYVDMDYEALQPMETFLRAWPAAFAALSHSSSPSSRSSVTVTHGAALERPVVPRHSFFLTGWENGMVINNALTVTTPQHPVLLDYVLPKIHANLSKGLSFWKSWNKGLQVGYMAGPFMWTQAVRKAIKDDPGNASNIHVVAPPVLYPYRNISAEKLTDAHRSATVTKYNSLGYHEYDGSWHELSIEAFIGGVILGRPQAIIGFVFAVLALLALVVGVIWWLVARGKRRRRLRRQQQQQQMVSDAAAQQQAQWNQQLWMDATQALQARQKQQQLLQQQQFHNGEQVVSDSNGIGAHQ